MATNFSEKVFTFTGEKALFSAPCHVLVGVSGGADSMALLHLLTHWPEAGVQVSAIHIHHGLRGESADRDAEFVKIYCKSENIPLTVFREDVAAFAQAEGLTVEEAGRRIRYADFERSRTEVGADYILTAHTASDQAETVLMRIIRGTGTDGLAGIPAIRDRIRRPLLCCSREEVEAYCLENQLDYVTDETNSDVAYTRNRIRHELLPTLKKINPSAETAILRLCDHATEDSAYFYELVNNYLSGDGPYLAKDVANFPTPIRRRIISRMFVQEGINSYDSCHLLAAEHIVKTGNGSVRLPSGMTFSVLSNGTMHFSQTATEDSRPFAPILLDKFPYSFIANGIQCHVSISDTTPAENVHNLFLQSAIDYDKIQGALYVRIRQEGDTIHPAGRGIGKSVKKLMNEYKIPTDKRDKTPVICDDTGVIWIPGYTCDERVKTTADTKHFLVWNAPTEQG